MQKTSKKKNYSFFRRHAGAGGVLGEEHSIFILVKKGVKPQSQAPRGLVLIKDLSGDVCA